MFTWDIADGFLINIISGIICDLMLMIFFGLINYLEILIPLIGKNK